jgi:hypothetical protein
MLPTKAHISKVCHYRGMKFADSELAVVQREINLAPFKRLYASKISPPEAGPAAATTRGASHSGAGVCQPAAGLRAAAACMPNLIPCCLPVTRRTEMVHPVAGWAACINFFYDLTHTTTNGHGQGGRLLIHRSPCW